jgi:hypothetical protein
MSSDLNTTSTTSTNNNNNNNNMNIGASYHTYKLQLHPMTKDLPFEQDEICIDMKRQMNGFAFTPEEKAMIMTEDDKIFMNRRIDAFRSNGLILLNPIFECTSCAATRSWEESKEEFELLYNHKDLDCHKCEEGLLSGMLSCTTWVYNNTSESGTSFIILENEEARKSKIPKDALCETRQVVPLLSKQEIIRYYCENVHELGFRVYNITQIIKHDPILAFNAMLHYETSLPNALAQLRKAYLDRLSYVENNLFYMKDPERERFAGRRTDLIIPDDYRSSLIEDESDIFIVSPEDKVKMMISVASMNE